MNLAERFKEHNREKNLFSPKDKLLLAVSGGVDSVVLCELCYQAGYKFIIAHCNFQLRGEESERDERFVKELGEKYKVKVEVKRFETEQYAAANKISIQEAARELRYSWFSGLVNSELGLVNNKPEANPVHHSPFTIHLLTAHQKDDNAETLLMHFFRGTGLHGLTGIAEKTGYIRRPLLIFSKEELLAFARENNLQWVEDSSNQSSKYTRNYFRNELLPALEKVYPQVKQNLEDNISRFIEIEKLYKYSVGEIRKKLCKKKENEIHIPVKQLMGYKSRALIYEIIHEYGFSEKQVDEVIKLSASETGKYIQLPENKYRIIRHRHWFIISPVAAEEAANIIIEEKDKEVLFPTGKLHLSTATMKEPSADSNTAMLDAKLISFPLILRKWKTGDYFYPLGMRKKKKISRFLIDQKLSKTQKENIWVIESDKRIIWVVGQRIDDRLKITPGTKQVLQISLSS